MTYCGSTWVSDWGWHEVVPYIREITGWDAAGGSQSPTTPGRLLVGLIDPTAETEHWFTTPGNATGRAPAPDTLAMVVDGTELTVGATLGSMGEGGAYNLAFELPDGLDLADVQRVTHVLGTQRADLTRIETATGTLDF